MLSLFHEENYESHNQYTNNLELFDRGIVNSMFIFYMYLLIVYMHTHTYVGFKYAMVHIVEVTEKL